MRTAIYVRVSTDEQAKEGYSISAQLNKLKAYCVSQNWTINDTYIDEGISAKDINRPQLQQMIDDIKDNKIDVVLVYRLDRLTRSVFDLYKLLETFDKYNCKFKSATEVYDTTTAMGRMFITIVAALAQWERENLGERVSMGMQEKALQGKYPGGRTAMGYEIINDKLEVVESEAHIIKTIFNMYINGYSANKIAKHLNTNKMYTRLNKKWYQDTITSTLRVITYTGAIERNGEIIENTHEAIIDKETFELAQSQLKDRADREPASISSDYIFSGLIQCNDCGRNLHGNKSPRGDYVYYNYRCTSVRTGRCNGTNTTVSEMQLEKQFIDMLSNDDYSDVIYSTDIDIKRDTKNVDRLKKELEEIKDRRSKWQFAWMENIISDSDLKERLEQETEKEKQIMKLLKKQPKQRTEYNKQEIIDLLKNIHENWNVLSRLKKKTLINQIIRRVEYRKEGRNVVVTRIVFV